MRRFFLLCVICAAIAGCSKTQQGSDTNKKKVSAFEKLQAKLDKCGISAVSSDGHVWLGFTDETVAAADAAAKVVRGVKQEQLPQFAFETASANISAEFLRRLKTIPNLTGMSFVNATPSAEAFAELSSMPALNRLHLQNFKVTEESLTVLQSLKGVQILKLAVTKRAADVLAALRTNESIQDVSLHYLTLDSELCEAIAQHKTLRKIHCEEVSTTEDVDFSAWKQLSQLQSLEVTNWSATWNCNYEFLNSSSKLESLSLRTNGVLDNNILFHLKGLKNLNSVRLYDTSVDNKGYRLLLAATSLRVVHIDGSQINDTGLKSAELPPTLEELVIENSPVSCATAVSLSIPESLKKFSINPSLLVDSELARATEKTKQLLMQSGLRTSGEGVRIWNPTTGKATMFGAPLFASGGVVASSAREEIAVGLGTAYGNQHIAFLDLKTGAFLRRVPILPACKDHVVATVSDDFEYLAVATASEIRITTSTGKERLNVAVAARPYALNFSPDARYLAFNSTSAVNTSIVDMSGDGKVAFTVPGIYPRFTADSSLFIVSSPGAIIRTSDGTTVRPTSGQFINDSQYVTCRSGNTGTPCIFEVFDISTGEQKHQVSLATGSHVAPWQASPQGMIANVEGRHIRFFDARSGKVSSVADAGVWMKDPGAMFVHLHSFKGPEKVITTVIQGIRRHP